MRQVRATILLMLWLGLAAAQQPQATLNPTTGATPQVVTVIQRLSGLQSLRLLREAEDGAIAQVNNAELLQSCHWATNITAGLVLDDGNSVMVYLAQTPTPAKSRPAACPNTDALTVYNSSGQLLTSKFIGFDARSGLSLLQVNGLPALVNKQTANTYTNQTPILVFTPQPAPLSAEKVTLGAMEARWQQTAQTSGGVATQFTISGLGLTPALVGGIAVNADNTLETIGLVVSARPNQARVLPLPLVLQAAARIRQRQANVPRPLLGVAAQDSVTPTGVVLTDVSPNTPAARAGLRAGDILLTLNGQPLSNVNDFSYLLAQRDGGETINLTAQRQQATLPFTVRLGVTNDAPGTAAPTDVLAENGLETLGLSAPVAKSLGARGGRVVLAVTPDSVAEKAGLRSGDIIEALNARPLRPNKPFAPLSDDARAKGKLTLLIMRRPKRFTARL